VALYHNAILHSHSAFSLQTAADKRWAVGLLLTDTLSVKNWTFWFRSCRSEVTLAEMPNFNSGTTIIVVTNNGLSKTNVSMQAPGDSGGVFK
jgi:hypothetical protein